jgi:uncharacterized membrane protein YkvA (DUF1232 family)
MCRGSRRIRAGADLPPQAVGKESSSHVSNLWAQDASQFSSTSREMPAHSDLGDSEQGSDGSGCHAVQFVQDDHCPASWRQQVESAPDLGADDQAGCGGYLDCGTRSTCVVVKVPAGAVAAYALSPIDLIPDFIPVLGYVDDVIIVPIGIRATVRLIPAPLMEEFRAEAAVREGRPKSRGGLLGIVSIWLAAITLAA